MLRARISGRAITLIFTILLSAIAAWLIRHVYHVFSPHVSNTSLAVVWLLSFLAIAWTNFLAALERPKTANAEQQIELNRLRVVALIPVYNEDEQLLQKCLESIFLQTRAIDEVFVVDDGSSQDYENTQDWLKQFANATWTKTPNRGKRHAQAVGIMRADADIYLTVDSDTILDPHAVEEGLKPFVDPEVQSVAGIYLPINIEDNLLTRFTGLSETVWQLVERSAQSTMGCVTVNSGILAFYRSGPLRKNIRGYLSETFFGREVGFSDDSLMTMYCLLEGKSVQQPTAIAFSAIPNKLSHHIRRYIRWMRGSFIRTWWRFKYLPLGSYVYWLHTFRWIQFGISTFLFIYLFHRGIFTNPELLPYVLLIPVIISYVQSLKYLAVIRNDISSWSQILTYLTAPISILWLLLVLRVVKWYAYATCLKTGWGTRKKVEVAYENN